MELDGSQPLPSEKVKKIPQGCGLTAREKPRQAGKAGPERSRKRLWKKEKEKERREGSRDTW